MIMTLAVQIVAILFMLTMIFIAIWTFIIINKAYGHFKYQNYLLEKIAQNISLNNKSKEQNSEIPNIEVEAERTEIVENNIASVADINTDESLDDNITYLNT